MRRQCHKRHSTGSLGLGKQINEMLSDDVGDGRYLHRSASLVDATFS